MNVKISLLFNVFSGKAFGFVKVKTDRKIISLLANSVQPIKNAVACSIENVLDSNPVSWDEDGICLVSWKVNGGRVWVPYAELRKACEAAYDSTMPSWPAMVEIAA